MDQDYGQDYQDAERMLLEQIRIIQNDYQKAIQPYIDELDRMRGMRVGPLYVVQQDNTEFKFKD